MSTVITNTDRIEKQIRLAAPRSRVWRALTDPNEFSQWFGVKLTGVVAPGSKLRGPVDCAGYEDIIIEATVHTVEPEKRFGFRWHPYALDRTVDYAAEPTTLVMFTLEDAGSGTLLHVVESGFDKIPASRRVKAFEMNSAGWTAQMNNIAKYLAG
jgi:uncharacterized protein YndB with AHSA1/START domain